MKLRPEFSTRHEDKVCRLQKSLYELKQAPHCWFAKLTTALKQYGFRQSYSDYSLFTYSAQGIFLWVLVNVDDLIVISNNVVALHIFKQHLSRCLHTEDLGFFKNIFWALKWPGIRNVLICVNESMLWIFCLILV